MARAMQTEAIETAAFLDTLAREGGEHASRLADAAELIRALATADTGRGRYTLQTLAAALEVAWPEVLPDPLPTQNAQGFMAMAKAVHEALNPARPSEGLKLNYRQIAYLKDLAAGCGIKRGETHPTMAALARHGLARYERRHWWITAAGRDWLARNAPEFQLPPP